MCSFLLAFLWLLRKSLLLVAFKKVFAQTRIFQAPTQQHTFSPTTKRKQPVLHDANGSSVRCWLFLSWVRGAVVRGESGAIKQGFLLKAQFLFSRRTQKGGEELARRDLVTGSACMKTNFHARTKMRLLLCRRRRAVEKHALALSLFFGVHVVTL